MLASGIEEYARQARRMHEAGEDASYYLLMTQTAIEQARRLQAIPSLRRERHAILAATGPRSKADGLAGRRGTRPRPARCRNRGSGSWLVTAAKSKVRWELQPPAGWDRVAAVS
jgi:hypothetical protein